MQSVALLAFIVFVILTVVLCFRAFTRLHSYAACHDTIEPLFEFVVAAHAEGVRPAIEKSQFAYTRIVIFRTSDGKALVDSHKTDHDDHEELFAMSRRFIDEKRSKPMPVFRTAQGGTASSVFAREHDKETICIEATSGS